MANISAIFSSLDQSKFSKGSNSDIKYGTAGFRAVADGLDYVVYRVGLLAAIRSKSLSGKVIGLMITASHNPEQDNGVKLVDPKGEMLASTWEDTATSVANAADAELGYVLQKLVQILAIDWSCQATVFLGRDTRPSSDRLAESASSAIAALGGTVVDCGVVTTPMLHYFVAEANARNVLTPLTNQDYFNKLSTAFTKLNTSRVYGNYNPVINFDGANGVGGVVMKELSAALTEYLTVNIFNSGNGRLNHLCGSDYVKVNKKAPDGVPTTANIRSVSVDGDADRLIYFYLDTDSNVHVLDGDRIATLLASYLIELLNASGLKLTVGLVQTNYANGAATHYVSDVLKVPLACTETGVKHLHHKATEFDIGVYFEANGHGTVVYSDHAKSLVQAAKDNPESSAEVRAATERLWGMMELTNQAVGDALSDLLLVETVLNARGWSLADWEASYTDLPNRLLKVTIKDRDVVTTTDAARKCLTPVGLQYEIDRLVLQYPRGRAFVRSSGTEDVVRVYSEASTQRGADELGARVSLAVFQMAEGVGDAPIVP